MQRAVDFFAVAMAVGVVTVLVLVLVDVVMVRKHELKFIAKSNSASCFSSPHSLMYFQRNSTKSASAFHHLLRTASLAASDKRCFVYAWPKCDGNNLFVYLYAALRFTTYTHRSHHVHVPLHHFIGWLKNTEHVTTFRYECHKNHFRIFQ